jgi:hypothetical protein
LELRHRITDIFCMAGKTASKEVMMLLLACNVIVLFSIIGGIHRWIGWVSGLMY